MIGKLCALNCLLQSRRRFGYSVDDHRHCRWPYRRLLVRSIHILCNIEVVFHILIVRVVFKFDAKFKQMFLVDFVVDLHSRNDAFSSKAGLHL